jgi:hypothetical protein
MFSWLGSTTGIAFAACGVVVLVLTILNQSTDLFKKWNLGPWLQAKREARNMKRHASPEPTRHRPPEPIQSEPMSFPAAPLEETDTPAKTILVRATVHTDGYAPGVQYAVNPSDDHVAGLMRAKFLVPLGSDVISQSAPREWKFGPRRQWLMAAAAEGGQFVAVIDGGISIPARDLKDWEHRLFQLVERFGTEWIQKIQAQPQMTSWKIMDDDDEVRQEQRIFVVRRLDVLERLDKSLDD